MNYQRPYQRLLKLQVNGQTFSTTLSCIDIIVRQVKAERRDLSTEFLLSNKQSSDSLLEICQYYVPHKIHKALKLVNKDDCGIEIPTNDQLEQTIYGSYVQLLDQLRNYEGRDVSYLFSKIIRYLLDWTYFFLNSHVNRLLNVYYNDLCVRS